MKIGILTLPIAENYGGILQAIALYRYLHNQGHDVVLIYKEFKQPLLKKLIKNLLIKIPFHDFKGIKTTNNQKALRERKLFHRPFIEKEIFKISESLYTKQELENFAKKENFDAVIVGSDQVWRITKKIDKCYKNYFLDFLDGSKIKKIAYAASFGKDYWEGKNDIKDISKLLEDFTAVSTREKSGVDICKKNFAFNNAIHVLDPTMLMSKEFYKNEIVSKYDTRRVPKNGLLTYILDEGDGKKEIINFVKKNLNIEKVHHLKGFNGSKIVYSVPEWLDSFANADFIVTDSFHGMVFSIVFEKNFIVIGNKSRGLERFLSLLSLLQLENRLINDTKEIEKFNFELIDYNKVNVILRKEIIKSFNYLDNVIKTN